MSFSTLLLLTLVIKDDIWLQTWVELHVLKGEHFHTIIFDEMGKAIGKLNVKKYWIFPKIIRDVVVY